MFIIESEWLMCRVVSQESVLRYVCISWLELLSPNPELLVGPELLSPTQNSCLRRTLVSYPELLSTQNSCLLPRTPVSSPELLSLTENSCLLPMSPTQNSCLLPRTLVSYPVFSSVGSSTYLAPPPPLHFPRRRIWTKMTPVPDPPFTTTPH